MASPVEICNMALMHLAVGTTIANLESEKSAEANACRTFYPTIRDATLRDTNWPFAKKTLPATLVQTTPNTTWAYAYRYPSDCITMRSIVAPPGALPIPYEMGQDDVGELIFTNQSNATLEYTVRIEDSQRYPSDFTVAFSLKLAMFIAPSITGGDPFKLGDKAESRYQYEISKAQAQSRNEEQDGAEAPSELERARG